MSLLHSVIIALSCFSALPMPFVAWDERNMRYMMAAFPLVGVVIGALSWLWLTVCDASGVGPFLRGGGLALIPLGITGGIHMDGFADVVDAQSSHAAPERKRQIMKDPHIGAFAAIGIAAYLLAYAALASELNARCALELACVPVISRCLSGWAAVSWPLASEKGMLATVVAAARRHTVRVMLLAQLSCVGVALLAHAPLVAVGMLGTTVAVAAWIRCMALRDFGGMSGDVEGFLLQVAELAMVACLVVFKGWCST